jgi:CHRD domain-containing protein
MRFCLPRLTAAAGTAALMLATTFAASPPALAASISFRAELNGENMVPRTDSAAEGYVRATYDTQSRRLSWSGAYSGLSSKVTRIAFHGPTTPAAAAGMVQRIGSLSAGSTTLSDAEAAQLIGGYWNITIQTRSHPGGEIRGQVVRGE